MIERLKRTIKTFKEMDHYTLQAWQFFLFGVIVLDLVGLWWWAGLKTLAGGILIVCVIGLGIFFALDRKFNVPEEEKPTERRSKKKKMAEDEETKEESKEESQEEPEKAETSMLDIDFGLPDADEYNKRLKKAVGSGF